MAPERIREQGYKYASDIWSMGCILYELAALHSPFFGVNISLTELCRRINSVEYPALPDSYSDVVRVSPACILPMLTCAWATGSCARWWPSASRLIPTADRRQAIWP
jgi:serine/threonine protein kinase